jgi:diaminopimelate decarboxylase
MIHSLDLASIDALPTPFYAYDLNHLNQSIVRAKMAAGKYGFHVHYAMKANGRPEILSAFQKAGFGADCVSGQEVNAAIEANFEKDFIAFAGVGKTDWEIDLAIQHEIFTINVESIEELVIINQRAEQLGLNARIALRLNPDVNAKTHHYITTGLEENKFGISAWQLDELFEVLPRLKRIELCGLHFHIGSQVTSLEPFKNLCNRINDFQTLFESRGYLLKHINAGGGLGVNYEAPDDPADPDFEAYFDVFSQYLQLRPNQELHFELGRALVANCGDLISRVVYVKKGRSTNFLILDAGMTELMRPALYQAFHKIENLNKSNNPHSEKYDVVGPICESSDCFGKAVYMPESERGDLVAIRSAGAYGECMSNRYNMRSLLEPFFY